MEAQETAAVVDFCMRLLQLYSSHNIGKVNVSADIGVLIDLYIDICSLIESHSIDISRAVRIFTCYKQETFTIWQHLYLSAKKMFLNASS